jgi:serine/threonine protein kinase
LNLVMTEENTATEVSTESGPELSIPGFEVIKRLGRGGMGEVYLARQTDGLDREVAIKTIHPNLSDANFRRRFIQEGQRQAQLHHSNVLPVFAAGEADDCLYLVMHYAPDGSLRDKMDEGPLSVALVVSVVTQVLRALQHAHTDFEKPVVHLDIKPDNILFDGDTALLADFGIARKLEEAGPGTVVAGDPRYWAPEQAANTPTPHSDIFALGTMFYEMLAGERPSQTFRTVSGGRAAGELVKSLPKPARKYGPLVARCLSEDPMQRPSEIEMLDSLEKLQQPTSRPFAFTALLTTALIVITLGFSSAPRTYLAGIWRTIFPLPLHEVSFVLSPVQSQLWIDGTERTFRKLSLPEGAHQVAIVADGYNGQGSTFIVNSGASTVTIDLAARPELTDAEYLDFSRSFGTNEELADRIWSDPTLANLVMLDILAEEDKAEFATRIAMLKSLSIAGDAVAATTLYYSSFEGLPVPGKPADYLASLDDASENGYALASILHALYIMSDLLDEGETFDKNPQAFIKVQTLLRLSSQQGLTETAALAAASSGVDITQKE